MPRQSEPSIAPRYVAAVKEATIAALVAFGLFALMVGIKTDQGPTSALVITTRFGVVAELVAIDGAIVRANPAAERLFG